MLYGRGGVYYRHAFGRGEVEGLSRNGRVRLLSGETEPRYGAVRFLDLDTGDASLGGYGEAELADSVLLPLRLAAEGEAAVCGGRQSQAVQFLFKLGVAQQKA